MVSFGLKVELGAATFLSGPIALPRSTCVTRNAGCGAAACAGGCGFGAAACGADFDGSLLLQAPRPPSVRHAARIRASDRKRMRGMRRVMSPPLAHASGIFRTCPGWIRSGFLIVSRLASKIRFHLL